MSDKFTCSCGQCSSAESGSLKESIKRALIRAGLRDKLVLQVDIWTCRAVQDRYDAIRAAGGSEEEMDNKCDVLWKEILGTVEEIELEVKGLD